MQMNTKKIAALLCGLLLALAVLAGCSGDAPTGALSSFTADTLDGGTFTQADLKGKDVTIINFWGTFCVPCLAEMPDLAEYAKALPENVQLITICLDAQSAELIDSAKTILADAGYEGVTLIPGEDPGFMALCQTVQAIPNTIFVDSAGNIVGDSILGGQEDLAEAFTAKLNIALKALGKAEVSVAG